MKQKYFLSIIIFLGFLGCLFTALFLYLGLLGVNFLLYAPPLETVRITPFFFIILFLNSLLSILSAIYIWKKVK